MAFHGRFFRSSEEENEQENRLLSPSRSLGLVKTAETRAKRKGARSGVSGAAQSAGASLRYNLLSRRLQLTSLDDVTFRSRLISSRAV